MNVKRKGFAAALINVLIILILSVLRFSGLATLQIGQAVPMIFLPVIIAIAMFYGDNVSILSAILAGALMDSMAANSSCFHTIFFVVAAAVCNFLSNRFVNRNLKAAAYLTLIVSLFYYFLKYLIYFVFGGVSVSYDYFLLYLIPSVVYTTALIIPFYFLEKKLSN